MTLKLVHLRSAFFASALLCTAGCGPRADQPPAKKENAAAATAAAPAALPEQVKRIVGRWVREDGGYVIEIGGGEAGGVLQAKYFNPQQNRSIAVSRAAWYEGGGRLQVLVELNDTGYPGATYILHHDPKTDKLAGEYKQPAMQQSFEIDFSREKKP